MHGRKDRELSERDRNLSVSDTAYSDPVYYGGMLKEAFPKVGYGGAKGAIYAAYRYIQPKVRKTFTERRARSIWEGKAARIDAEEADVIRRAQIEEARREHRELIARLERLEKDIAMADSLSAGEALASRRNPSRAMGKADRS